MIQLKAKYRILAAVAFVGIIGGVLGSLSILSSSAHALDSTAANKAMAYGIYECYKDGNIINKVSLADYDGLSSITNFGNSIILPSGYYSVDYVNCGQLLGGDPISGFSGVAAINGVTIPENNSNTSLVSSFMQGMGYHETKADGGRCASYTYAYKKDPSSTSTLKMCASVDENNHITSSRVEVSGDEMAFQIQVEDNAVKLDCSQIPGDGGCGRHTFEPGKTDFDTFAGAILGDLEQHRSEAVCIGPFCSWQLVHDVKLESRGDVMAKFEFRDRGEAGQRAMQYLTGYNSLSAAKLTENEKIALLQDYLANYYKIDNYGCDLDSSQQNIAIGAGYTPIRTSMFSGNYQVCLIKPTENVGNSVAGYNSQGFFDGTPMSYDEIISIIGETVDDLFAADKQKCNNAADQQRKIAQNILGSSTASDEQRARAQQTMDELNLIKAEHGEYWHEENGAIVCYEFTGTSGETVSPPTNSTTPPSASEGGDGATGAATDLDECFNSAGALGWILCPVLSFVSTAVDNIYTDYIQDQFLEVKAETLSTSSEVYNSWKVIRNVANIIFVIMFLIVMLSQLTGIGISNYGIKKLLPRLIVIAILVNASFFICQFAVDLSNILGYGLNQLFIKITPGVNDAGTGSLVFGGIMSGLTWAGIFAAAVSTVGTWLIPLLLALLSGMISVIFGGIILGLRQAGVLILVVLSPVAIVCYALPNAKSFYDRWFKLFTSLLMVFPVCGALMGGGLFASNLIAGASSSVLMQIIAMLIRVAPFFMIPSLVKSSLAAIGDIGAKVSNFGSKLGRTATGSIARSEFMKQRDADLARFQGTMTAKRGRILNRVLKKNPDELSDRRKAKIARQYARYNKLRGEEATAMPYAMVPGSREYTAAQNAAHQKRISTLADNIESENVDIATDSSSIGSRLDQAMDAYERDQSDENMAAIQAFTSMLVSNADNGLSALQNSFGRANEAGLEKSTKALSQYAVRTHTKDIKPVARELYGELVDAADGKLSRGTFVQKDGNYTSLGHLARSITGYDDSNIGKINETSLDRMISHTDTLKKDKTFVDTFDDLTTGAFANPNVHIQPKVAEKINKVRSGLGLSILRNNSEKINRDSGNIQVHGNENADQNNESGPVLHTGNDDRS